VPLTPTNFVGTSSGDVPSPNPSAILSHLAGGGKLGDDPNRQHGHVHSSMDGDRFALGTVIPTYPSRLRDAPHQPELESATLQYVNLSCFTPSVAPASMAAQCDTAFFSAVTKLAPSGMVYARIFSAMPAVISWSGRRL